MINSDIIKKIMIDKKIKPGAVADLIGDDRQVFYNKINRGIKKLSDLEKVAAALDCEIVLQDNKTGIIYK